MLEITGNAFQLLLTGFCAANSIWQSFRTGFLAWTLLGLFAAGYFLGDLYWTLYLFFYHVTPEYAFIPDLSYYASHIFLLLLVTFVRYNSRLLFNRDAAELRKKQQLNKLRILILVLLFTIGMGIYFMQYGQYVSNTVYIMLMSGLLYNSMSGLLDLGEKGWKTAEGGVFFATLFFCLVEYCAWFSSCIVESSSPNSPYIWFESLLALGFCAFIPAIRRSVD